MMENFYGQGESFFQSLAKQIPMLSQLKKVPQDPQYHGEGNVFIHTSLVCDALTREEEWLKMSKDDRDILLFSAAFHDIGKLTCTKSFDGKIGSPNHAVKGAEQFRRLWLRYYGSGIFPEDLTQRDQIAWLIRWHGLPPLFLEKEKIELAVRKAARTVSLRFLALLSEADLKGRKSKECSKQLETIQYFREYAKELGCYEVSPNFPNDYTKLKYLRGELDWYGECLYEPKGFSVVLMMGLPLSGKDTYIRQYVPNLPVISLDDIRQELSIEPGKDSNRVVAQALERAKQYLRKKEAFVWNATNLTKRIRGKLCRMFEQYGANVTILNIEAPYQELLIRNQKRERKIPDRVLEKMLQILEYPEPWESYHVATVWNFNL